MRADALRNRERILAEAAEAFAAEGAGVGVAEIARRAGVGVGTLFRHFPTKRDLLLAVLERGFADARTVVTAALEQPDPWKAFAGMVIGAGELQARDHCFAEAAGPELFGEPRLQDMRDAIVRDTSVVLERAQRAGAVREDVGIEDLLVLFGAAGAVIQRVGGGRPAIWQRAVLTILDGLRPAGASELPGPGPSFEELTELLSCPAGAAEAPRAAAAG